MIKKLEQLAGGPAYLIGLLITFVVGTFLRFYRLYDYVTFLGDQGRDAIILKRLITLEHLPAIGAPTSVGAVFLGPFYYYFIAPWIALFRFDPVGPAYGVAFFSSLALLVQYFAVKDLFGKRVALISTILSATAWAIIEPSRFSWNPNLLAQSTFLATYLLVKCIKTGQRKWFILFGLFSAITVQFHYLALIALPAFTFFIVIYIFRSKQQKKALFNTFIAFFIFLTMCIPLFIFDLRHNFLNTRNFAALFSTPSGVSRSGSVKEIIMSMTLFNSYFFQYLFSEVINGAIIVGFAVTAFIAGRRRNSILMFITVFITLLVGTSLYQGTRHPHYFNSMYIVYAVILAYLLAQLTSRFIGWVAVGAFMIAFSVLNIQNYVFVHNSPSYQIARAQKIARAIFTNISSDKFTVTALPNQYSDATYRYFLEIWGKRSIEKDSLDAAQELFIVCESACKPIGNPQWDIAYFAPTKIVKIMHVKNITIYKLSK